MQRNVPLLARLALLLLAAGVAAACDGCAEPPEPPAGECVLDGDCPLTQLCAEGLCVDKGDPSDAGPADAGSADAGPEDAGPEPLGVLTALPEANIEFGATRIGVAVERNVTLKNTGAVALRVLQLALDDTSATFAVSPVGFLDTELAPGAELGV